MDIDLILDDKGQPPLTLHEMRLLIFDNWSPKTCAEQVLKLRAQDAPGVDAEDLPTPSLRSLRAA